MIIVSVGSLDLGNNFSYEHFIDALSDTQVERVLGAAWDLDSDVRIIGKGNYSKVTLNTCGNDLADHLRGRIYK